MVTLLDEPVEIVQRPEWMIEQLAAGRRVFGDCDDVAVLSATLFCAIGLPVRLVAVRPAGAEDFMHVFPEVFVGGQWRMTDPTSDQMPAGQWERMVEVI